MEINKKVFDSITVILIIALITTGMFAGTVAAKTDEDEPAREDVQGKYKFEYLYDGQWREFDTVDFGKFPKDIQIQLPENVLNDEPIKIKMSKVGGGYGFIDYISVDNKTCVSDSSYINKKLSGKDLDVMEVKADEPLILDFTEVTAGKVVVTARIEEEVLTAHPFFLGAYKDNVHGAQPYMNYKLGDNVKTVPMDGKPSDLSAEEAFGVFETQPVTGHPDGDAYCWVYNDDEFMYFIGEWTTDNTYDYGQDYFRVYVKDNEKIKSFTQYSDGGEYGESYMAYTDKVGYEHMYYKMKVPLSEIKGDSLKLGFEIYGTGGHLLGMEFDKDNFKSISAGRDTIFRINYELSSKDLHTNKLIFLLLVYENIEDLNAFKDSDYRFMMKRIDNKFLFGYSEAFEIEEIDPDIVNELSHYNLKLQAYHEEDFEPFNAPGVPIVSGEPKIAGTVGIKTSFPEVGKYKLAVVTFYQWIGSDIPPGYYSNHSKSNLATSEIDILTPPPNPTVSFNSGKGSKVSPIQLESGSKIGKLPVPKRKGYIFLGWYADGKKIDENLVVTTDLTLTAKWTKGADKIKSLKPSTGKLSPVFAANKTKYKLKIPKTKKSVTIKASKFAKKAKVEIKVGKGKYKKKSSIKVSLKKGKKKTVYIKVKNKGYKAKVYKITVSRAK